MNSGNSDEDVECPYCEETFSDEVEEGKHRAEKHVNDESIAKPDERRGNIDVTEEWRKNAKDKKSK